MHASTPPKAPSSLVFAAGDQIIFDGDERFNLRRDGSESIFEELVRNTESGILGRREGRVARKDCSPELPD